MLIDKKYYDEAIEQVDRATSALQDALDFIKLLKKQNAEYEYTIQKMQKMLEAKNNPLFSGSPSPPWKKTSN